MKIKVFKKIIETFVCTIFPFIIPILMELDFTKEHIAKPMYYIIYIVLICLDACCIIWVQVKKKQRQDDVWINKASRYAYSNLYELNEIKQADF